MANWASDWSTAKNLLCVRLDSMGDVLMTEPAMRSLKQSVHGRRITLLTSPAGAEAAALLPEVDDVLVYRAPWMKIDTDGPRSDLAFIEDLRGRHFDGAVIFTVYSQNPLPAALTLYLADVPRRLAHCRENPYHLLTHWQPEPEPERLQRHEVQRQLDLVASIGCRLKDQRMRLQTTEAQKREALAAIVHAGIDAERRWMVVHPGASAPSRRYRADGFAAVVRRLRDENIQIVLTGSGEEASLLQEIQSAAGLPPEAVVLDLGLGALAALLAEAPLLLSNNTGPVHLAAAVGTPVVDLYALTNPQHTPWQVPSRVLYEDVECKWCYSSRCPQQHHACLDALEPEAIVAAVLELLAAQQGASDVMRHVLAD